MDNLPEIVSSAALEAGRPRVSVHMITYGHERFIRQAVESALMQETDFPFEIIVGEDCSKDGTRAILRELQRAHPDRVKLILPQKNVGALRNSISVIHASRGEYMAFLEGDDYWTDPKKLQKQVDVLDRNRDCVICHHRIQAVDGTTGEVKYEYPLPEDRVPFQAGERFFVRNFVQTCAAVMRREFVPEFDEGFKQLTIGDHPFFILASQHGRVAYVDDLMAHYRLHGGGVYSSIQKVSERTLPSFRVMEYLADHRELKRSWRRLALRRGNELFDGCLEVIREKESTRGVFQTMLRQAGRAVKLLNLPTLWFLCMMVLKRMTKRLPGGRATAAGMSK